MATKLITPSVATQVTQALQPTQATVQTQPTQALTATLPTIEKLQVIQRNKQYNAKQVETFLANYNDPTELNSYIDALTNREAVSKEFGDTWGTISTASGSVAVLSYVASAVLELAAWVLSLATTDAGAIGAAGSAAAKAIRGLGTAAKVASTVGKVASLPAIPAAAKVAYDYGIKPIAHGKGNEAFLNTLMNLGETMDAAANPVKGLFIEGPQGFIKGTGLADGGRVQYDYDTGNVAADMFLEIISDPLNWIEMPVKAGIKGAAKTAAKNTVEASTETIIKNVNDIIKNVDGLKSIGLEGTARIQKKVQKTAQRLAIQWSEASTKKLTKEQTEVLVKQGTLELQRTLTRAIESEIKNVSGTTLELALKKAGKEIEWNKLTQESLSSIYKNLEFDKLATHTIKELSKITAYTDAFQASMTKGALMTSGYGAGITLIKKLGDPLITWFKNKHIQGMVSAKYFDQVKGITDLTKFEEAKNYWVNLGKYGSNLLYNATESPIQDVDSFYRYFVGQLDRDQQLFRKALQDHVTEPNAQFAAFNALTQELYGLDFTQYLEYLKTINKNNNNLCAKHLQYLDSVHSNIFKQAATQSVAEGIKTSAQLYAKHTITDLIKEPIEILKKLQAVKTAKNPDDIVKTLYTLKLNDFAVNAALVNDPKISEVLLKINNPDGIGAFLDNIISDAKTLEPEMLATLSDNVRVLKSAGQNFINIRDLYDNIAKMSLPKIEGVNTDDFKRYVLDQIFGFTDDVNSLLANFDNTTMRDLMTRIEMFLGEGTNYFKFTETTYKVVYDQIASAFKGYLVAQQTAGLNTIKATIVQNFTQAIDDLLKQFPQFSNELQELASVSDLIKMTLATVRKENEYFLNLIFTDSETIFKAYSARQLSDMGLALRTVATKECLEMFDNIDMLSSNQLLQVEKMGKRMMQTMKQCAQYSHMFTTEILNDITNLYDNVWRDFVEAVDDPDLDLFKLLIRDAEDTVDPIKRFAHLVELYKTISGNETLLKEWQNIINPLVLSEPDVAAVYRLIANPKMLYKTDFAWDAMAQAAFYAERDFNQKLINLVGLYDDLGVASKKIDADFKDLHEILSSDAVNNPKILQLERYSRATKSVISTLDWFREKYNSLFDTKLAHDTIDDLRKTFLGNTRLYEKYKDTIDTLEKYWRGEIQFKQDPKYVQGGIDEFTPFWEKVKEMNKHYVAIQRSSYNEAYLYNVIKQKTNTNVSKRYEALKTYFQDEQIKENVLRILNDPEAMQTDADWQAYRDFLKILNENVSEDEIIIQIPIAFQEQIFNFIADTYHISDVNIIYEALSDSYGYTNRAIIDMYLNAALLDNKEAFMGTVHHEALHNITSTLTDLERTELYKYTLKTLQENRSHVIDFNIAEIVYAYLRAYNITKFSTSNTAYDFLTILRNPYYVIQDIADPAQRADIYDEILAFTFSDKLLDFSDIQKSAADIEAVHNLSEKLRAPLQKIARERIPFTPPKQVKVYNQAVEIKNVTPWDPIRKMQEVNKAIHRASDANALSSLQRVFSFTPEQLQKELTFRHRFITFSDSDLSGNKTLSRAFNRLKSITNAELGIHYIYDPIKQRHWIVLDKQVRMQGREVYLDGVHLIREKFTKTFNEFQQVDTLLEASEDLNLTKMFNEMSDNLETLTGSALGDSQGEFFSKEMMQKVYAEMPEEVKAILKEEDILQNEFFEAYAFNESILGTAASKNKLGMSSPNMIINAQNAITQAQCYIKAKTEYVHTVFDSMFSISGENSIYAKFSDADLLQALQSNSNYKLVALTDHKKYGLRVEEILPINEAAIKKGRELGAVIVPLQTYKDMYKMVNRRLGSSGLLKIWNRIMYVFKFGYLVRPGAWIRNWIDTNLKTNIELGSEASAYRNQSRKILRELEEINDFIAARDTDGFLRRAAIEEYFMTHPNSNLTIELYDEITTLYKPSGILGNIMSAEGLEDGADLWNTFTHYTGKIIDMGNKTEEVNRLALLLAELDKGADTTSAIAKLAKTHFDYSFKTNTEQLIEMIFPFTTFTLRNLSYWAEALEKHPWLMRNYIHFMKPHWDFKDYTPEELATNYQVQNQIKYGQLKLAEFEDKIITFKMNPSIQDALQMFSDPINNIYEKLAAPIAEPLKAATGQYNNPLNLVPGIGPTIQDIRQTFKTGSPLPSAIGVMNKPVKKGIVKFKNNNLVNVNAYRWNSYHRPVYTKNTVIDSYSTIGVQRYQTRFYPVIDVAHDVKNMYSTNVYNKIKNKVKTDVYQGIRYRIRLDTNRFR